MSESTTGRGPAEDATPLSRGMLHIVATGCRVVEEIHRLVEQAVEQGWQVGVVASHDAVRIMGPDRVKRLEELTGRAVVSEFYAYTPDRDRLPDADAVIVAPVSAKSLNRWSLQSGTGLAGAYLNELPGLNKPVVAMPYVSESLARHPHYSLAVRALRRMGVRVLDGKGISMPERPELAREHRDRFPWHLALSELDDEIERRRRTERGPHRVVARVKHAVTRRPLARPGERWERKI